MVIGINKISRHHKRIHFFVLFRYLYLSRAAFHGKLWLKAELIRHFLRNPYRPSTLCIYQYPDRVCIGKPFSGFIIHRKIPITIKTLHPICPCLHGNVLRQMGHVIKANLPERENPCQMMFIQIINRSINTPNCRHVQGSCLISLWEYVRISIFLSMNTGTTLYKWLYVFR